MSWLFSRALVAEYLEESCSGGEPLSALKLSHMPPAYSWPVKTTGHSRLSRFGMTCEHLTGLNGEALLTWFRADFPAKTSALPVQTSTEKNAGSTETEAASGRTCGESLARYDRGTRSWKTHQRLLFEDSTESLETFPSTGIMLDGEIFTAQRSEAVSQDNDCSFLPTLCATETKDSGKAEILARMDRGGRVARRLCNSSLRTRYSKEIVFLNPCFAEWMMGWPEGFTESKPLETARFQAWLDSHGKL